MGLPARKADRRYTYRDYRSWPEDERWELIAGVAWNMSAAPSVDHQRISMELSWRIRTFLEGKPCEVLAAPVDVFFPQSREQDVDDVEDVVQPDLLVVCDHEKITHRGCWGAPDWVIEIISPYTSHKDMNAKLSLYERHGVGEYWIVDPGNRCVHVHLLGEDGRYPEPLVRVAPDPISSSTCNGLTIDLAELFGRHDIDGRA